MFNQFLIRIKFLKDVIQKMNPMHLHFFKEIQNYKDNFLIIFNEDYEQKFKYY